MSYIKITQYIYLGFAVLFIYFGIDKMGDPGNDMPYISFILAASCVFMFFFRRRFAKKIEENQKKP
jgi:Na+/melibiose symporter-like transporter